MVCSVYFPAWASATRRCSPHTQHASVLYQYGRVSPVPFHLPSCAPPKCSGPDQQGGLSGHDPVEEGGGSVDRSHYSSCTAYLPRWMCSGVTRCLYCPASPPTLRYGAVWSCCCWTECPRSTWHVSPGEGGADGWVERTHNVGAAAAGRGALISTWHVTMALGCLLRQCLGKCTCPSLDHDFSLDIPHLPVSPACLLPPPTDLQAAEPLLAPGALVVADNAGVFKDGGLKPYLGKCCWKMPHAGSL